MSAKTPAEEAIYTDMEQEIRAAVRRARARLTEFLGPDVLPERTPQRGQDALPQP